MSPERIAMLVAIGCALIGAVFLALGAQQQSKAVRLGSSSLRVSGSHFLQLLRNPRWLFGLSLTVLGMVLNVYALATAPLTVVQPLGAVALVIATVVNAKDQGLKINRGTVRAISLCLLGSVAFVLLALRATKDVHHITSRQELITVGILAAVVVASVVVWLMVRHKHHPIFYIIAAGVLFGFCAVMVRTMSMELTDPNGLMFGNVSWWEYVAIAVAGLLGSYFVQNAYSSGPPELVIAGLTVIDPMVGIMIGIIILGELGANVPWWVSISMVAAGLVAIVGVAALARYHPDIQRRRSEAEHQPVTTLRAED
ncbi:hypothetical protein GCM10027027_00600 [Neomicrococcus lactis]|uniref:Multidrug DMT transporter permease n=2 Tax=Neomicrococcus lactis TaxID=732241 RepID=A0A7W8YB02_9MICC|nr:hypothetical protein [Neomicrococcus lactis]